MNCGDFCECEGLMNNTCHFGPDITGKFLVEVPRAANTERVTDLDIKHWHIRDICYDDSEYDAICELVNKYYA